MTQLLNSKRARADVVFKRIINVAPDVLYKAWTDAKQVAVWWGPYGFTNPVCIWNAQVNGIIYVEMTSPDGMAFPMKGIFHEVMPSKKIIFTTEAFEDENGNFQMVVLNTVTIAPENGNTQFELEAKVIKATPVVKNSLEGMQQGWSQSLDKLEELLTKTKIYNL
jgi:uncharacterized protein YndB with AHSA1/START domain